jgi:hypothetical protein
MSNLPKLQCAIRKRLKGVAGIGYGASGPLIEATLLMLGRRITNAHFTKDEKQASELPTWVTDDWLRRCWEARGPVPKDLHEDIAPASAPVPEPAIVAEHPGAPSAVEHPAEAVPPAEAVAPAAPAPAPSEIIARLRDELGAKAFGHLNTRGAERWAPDHKELWIGEVRKLQKQRSWKNKPFSSVKGHEVYRQWSLLDEAEQVKYLLQAKAKWDAKNTVTPSSASEASAPPLPPPLPPPPLPPPLIDDAEPDVEAITPAKKRLKKAELERLGQAMLDTVGEIAADPSTPFKTLDVAKRLVTVACKEAGFSREGTKRLGNISYSGRKSFEDPKLIPNKPGRLSGSCRHDDAEMREAFQAHVVPSARWHAKLGRPIESLQGSISGAWCSDSKLKELYSKRHTQRRLSRCRCAIGSSQGRTDACDVCTTWDSIISPAISAEVTTFVSAVTSLQADYWAKTDWESEKLDHSILSETQAWLTWIEMRHLTRPLEPAVESEIQPLEAGVLERFKDEWLPIIAEFCNHWSAKWCLRELFDTENADPGAGTFGMIWDHMDCNSPHSTPTDTNPHKSPKTKKNYTNPQKK